MSGLTKRGGFPKPFARSFRPKRKERCTTSAMVNIVALHFRMLPFWFVRPRMFGHTCEFWRKLASLRLSEQARTFFHSLKSYSLLVQSASPRTLTSFGVRTLVTKASPNGLTLFSNAHLSQKGFFAQRPDNCESPNSQ